MRVEIARGFLSAEECSALNEWALLGVENGWLDAGVSRGKATRTRLTSRMYGDRFETPSVVKSISEKIRAYAGVHLHSIIEGHGRDGVVVSCTYAGGDVYEHKDPRSFPELATLRCNVMTQKSEAGGILHLEGRPVELDVGDLHCYLASEHAHNVDPVVGDTPRILWMFGACVPAEDWNSGRIEFGVS